MKFELKEKFYGGYVISEKWSNELIRLGNIVIMKEEYKTTSYCVQFEKGFDYHEINKALCGKTWNDYVHFKPKHILVIQMK